MAASDCPVADILHWVNVSCSCDITCIAVDGVITTVCSQILVKMHQLCASMHSDIICDYQTHVERSCWPGHG